MKQDRNTVHPVRGRDIFLGMAFLLGSGVHAQTDSTDLLFAADPVRQYSIAFYDTAWSGVLQTFWEKDSGYLPARFTDGSLVLDSVGVRYKGNSSFTLAGNNPKKPFKIKFNEFRSQTYYGTKTLNFSNGIGDPSLLREKIGYDIARRIGPAPRANFATLEIDGKPLGLYTQVEQADKTFLKRWFSDATGNLFKAGDDGASLSFLGTDPSSYANSGAYELKTNETKADWTGFARFVDFLNTPTDEVFCTDRARFLDDENVAKFLAFNAVLSNFDSYNGSGRNWYAYQMDSTGAMRMIPWDLNQSFGAYGGASSALSIRIDTVQAPLASRPLFARMLRCEPLRQRFYAWAKRLAELEASTDSILATMVADSARIAAFVAADSNKFYPTSAWKTNLRSNFRATEGLIPGLVSFSTSRNATVLAQIASLPAGSLAAARPDGRATIDDASWNAAASRLEGLSPLGSGIVRWRTLDGRSAGRLDFASGTSSLSLSLPRGAVVLELRTANRSRSILVLNTRK
jgi:hypothetical protein